MTEELTITAIVLTKAYCIVALGFGVSTAYHIFMDGLLDEDEEHPFIICSGVILFCTVCWPYCLYKWLGK